MPDLTGHAGSAGSWGGGYYHGTNSQLQQSHMTAKNRFPKIFESAKQMQPSARRVLSFGCSTGEEAQTLAEYFPDAEIVGVDIDYNSVVAARKNNAHKDRVFYHTDLGATGKYDVVTCLMVLFSLEKPVPHDKWLEAIRTIDKHTNIGGVVMLYTSDHPFKSADVADNYEAIREWVRVHDKNKKEYFCGYYRKVRVKDYVETPPEVPQAVG